MPAVSVPSGAPTSPRPSAGALVGLVLLLGLATILGAWGFELIGGYVPCKLCLEQRDPYYAALPLLAVAFVALRLGWSRWFVVPVLVLVVMIFLYGGSLGIYQSGAEWGFWPGPQDCGATRGGQIPTNAGDLLGSLDKVKIVDCTKVQFRLLGLSFAGWNVVASLTLVAGTIWAAVRAARPA